ncbi:MAG: tetratricopeptide repeat protein [Proteobacteria bacterium]|nr:tetratricopeptide repeat protein [Pseudomonadota bacterium]
MHGLVSAILLYMAVSAMAAPPHQASDPASISDSRCGSCHADADRAWRSSHHARAMQPATTQTVLGDFAGRQVADGGETVFLYRAKGAFYARARGADSSLRSYRILYTFGIDPLQQYLVAAPNGRLQSLTVAWDVRQRRWFSLADGNTAAFDAAMHWSGRYYNWNLMCAECHSSGVLKHYDAKTDSYSTTWTALQVGCQACHGPGRAHAEAARRGRLLPMPVDFHRGEKSNEIDQCARCHAVRSRITRADEAGTPLLDHFRPETLRAGLYYPDGQQQGEVFEFGSFRQSRMYQSGVRCTDCHDPHGGKLKRPGNATCTACHNEASNERFPGRPLRHYDDSSHHFHVSGDPGSHCVDCHMPAKMYMGVHSRRDHAFRIPRPDLSERLGVPNACNKCHADRDSRWATNILAARYGERKPAIHFGETFVRARRGDLLSAPALAAMVTDQEQSAIVRATAIDLLGSLAADVPIKALSDPDATVRASAAAALARNGAAAPLLPMLNDPIRAVRIAAARSLGAAGQERVPADYREPFTRTLDEYKNSQLAMADAPVARLNLASLARDQVNLDEAEDNYRAALAMDPQLDRARTELASLLVECGEEFAAATLLRQGIDVSPDPAPLEFALGLLLGGAGRFLEADAALRASLEHRPDASRVRYNHALVLMRLERWNEAEMALNAVRANTPDNADALYALALLHAQTGRIDSARNIARDWLVAHPEDSRFERFANWQR